MVSPSKITLDLSGLRVLMLAPCLGKFGGIETFCLTLIEDLIIKGATVHLLRKKVAGFQNDMSIERNESEIRSSWTSKYKPRFKSDFVSPRDPKIKQAIKECDLVHLHNPMVEGVWYAKKFSKPCVMTIYNWRRTGLHPRLWVWKWAVAQADRRWYISEFVWNSWEKRRRSGSARLPVVSRMPKGEILHKKRLGFLFIGRWVPNKGICILLEAYRRISPDPNIWPLILVGDGPLRKEIEKEIKNKNIKGVTILGFVSENERQQLTKKAKWMVTPPHTQEDLGLTPLEARSVGVPCIASTDGGVQETAGPYALFCKPGDIDSLKACLSLAIEMSEEEYKEKSRLAKTGLDEYVRPLDEYAEEYLKLLKK
jgi:glycosyltransferase involved in cell wall biosynthesis